jgi:hypothetical protein
MIDPPAGGASGARSVEKKYGVRGLAMASMTDLVEDVAFECVEFG